MGAGPRKDLAQRGSGLDVSFLCLIVGARFPSVSPPSLRFSVLQSLRLDDPRVTSFYDDTRPKIAILPKEVVCDNFYQGVLAWSEGPGADV